MSLRLGLKVRLSSRRCSVERVENDSHPKPKAMMLTMAETIKLTATSNYKLAQLTFAPPDLHSLRKLTLVKNMVDLLYKKSPEEWLHPMTRWIFFTPESLSQKSQEDLENIIEQYIALKQLGQINLDVGKDHKDSSRPSKINVLTIDTSMDKPLPKPSVLEERKITSPIHSRMSWTSDTGMTMCNVLAGELMTLFDMEFNVDIELKPTIEDAPRLPELSFKSSKEVHEAKRVSADSFTCLIPAFQAFKLDGGAPLEKTRPRRINFPPPPITPPPCRSNDLVNQGPRQKAMPLRTSSLGNLFISQDSPATDTTSQSADQLHNRPDIKNQQHTRLQKNSFQRLTSFIRLRSAIPDNISAFSNKNPIDRKTKAESILSEASTVATRSSTSSDVIRVATKSDPYVNIRKNRQRGTLNETKASPGRRSLASARPIIVDISELRRSSSVGRRHRMIKKRQSLVEKSTSRRKSVGERQSVGQLRKKPSFVEISSKLNPQKSLRRAIPTFDKIKRGDLNSDLVAKQHSAAGTAPKTKAEEAITFAKRITSIGRRMKLQRV